MTVDALKNKVVKEFLEFLCLVRKGHKPDYEYILEEISYIENNPDKNLTITALQYYLNNKWQRQF